jgi:hypothetical protein
VVETQAEQSSESDWLATIRSQLGMNAEAISAALDEVASMCGDPPPVGWVDVRQQPLLTVYLVHEGVVYLVSGERDGLPDRADVAASADTLCQIRVVPITSDASFSTDIIRTARSVGEPAVVRVWGLHFGEAADEELTITYPPDDPNAAWSDPAPFAHALIAAIVRAKRADRGRADV